MTQTLQMKKKLPSLYLRNQLSRLLKKEVLLILILLMKMLRLKQNLKQVKRGKPIRIPRQMIQTQIVTQRQRLLLLLLKKGKFITSTPAPTKPKVIAAPPSAESNVPVNAPPEGASDSGIEEDKKKADSKFAPGRKSNTPFRRVVAEEIEVNPMLADNSANSSFDTWGAKATQDLIVTKGKSFRHEKTKKKRGSYKGGPINMGVA